MELEVKARSFKTFSIQKITFNDFGQVTVNTKAGCFFLPRGSYQDAETLTMKRVKCGKFPRGIGTAFPKLKVLAFNDCEIKRIYSEDFEGLDNLQVLNLSNNLIEELNGDVFNKLTGLKQLIITHNKIKFITVSLFDELRNIEGVHMNENLRIDKFWVDMEPDSASRLEMIKEIALKCNLPTPAALVVQQQKDEMETKKVAMLEAEIKDLKLKIAKWNSA